MTSAKDLREETNRSQSQKRIEVTIVTYCVIVRIFFINEVAWFEEFLSSSIREEALKFKMYTLALNLTVYKRISF